VEKLFQDNYDDIKWGLFGDTMRTVGAHKYLEFPAILIPLMWGIARYETAATPLYFPIDPIYGLRSFHSPFTRHGVYIYRRNLDDGFYITEANVLRMWHKVKHYRPDIAREAEQFYRELIRGTT
jgi:hypothetical protein